MLPLMYSRSASRKLARAHREARIKGAVADMRHGLLFHSHSGTDVLPESEHCALAHIGVPETPLPSSLVPCFPQLSPED